MTSNSLSLRNPGLLGSLGGGAIPLFDDFNRPNSVNLGITSIGEVPWEQWSGDWDIYSNRIRNTSGTNPLAVVDGGTPDCQVTLDISSGGRDALIFRASDVSNWLRFSYYENRTSSTTTTCTPVTRYTRSCYDGSACFPRNSCGSCPSSCTGGWSCGPCSCSCSVANSQLCSDDCTTSTTYSYTRRVYLHKMVNGSLQTVSSWSASLQTQLRVRAIGDQITLWRNTTLLTTLTEAFNMDATFHGVGRSQLGNQSGTALDNFDMVPDSYL